MAVQSQKLKAKKSTKKKTGVSKPSPAPVYYYAVGRRKTAVAAVKIYENKNSQSSEDDFWINKKKLQEYFPAQSLQNLFLLPLRTTGNLARFQVKAKVRGGGFHAQAEALKLALARALVKFDPALKSGLKALGLLTCDARVVERKKAGLKKARRAPQWAKR